MAPTLGLIVFGLSFVVFALSGKFYVVQGYFSPRPDETPETRSAAEITETSPAGQISGRPGDGKKIYDTKCLSCHAVDTDERKIGPSLRGLLERESLPHTGNAATVENIKKQLDQPALTMPAYKDFTDQELADLMAYLQTI